MAGVVATRSVILTARGMIAATARIRLPPLAETVGLTLARRTTATPLVWPDDTGRLITRLVLTLDGVTIVLAQGSCSGGIRLDRLGDEIPEYSLQASSYRWVDRVKTSVIALAGVAEVHIEVELVRGTVTTTAGVVVA